MKDVDNRLIIIEDKYNKQIENYEKRINILEQWRASCIQKAAETPPKGCKRILQAMTAMEERLTNNWKK